MRTIRTLMQELTVEEYRSIEDRAKKALLFNLLTEVGYETAKMQKVTYTDKELNDRLVAAIRNDKCEIQSLRNKLELVDKKYIKNLDDLFDILQQLRGNKI